MKVLSFLFLSALLVSCAKDKSYETLLKENVYTKDFFKDSEKEDYLYLVSVGNTPKDITASRPYWQGDGKLIKFKFGDDSLDVVEKVLDERYQENDLNQSPVISFKISHVGYKCKEDDFGDCTNEEEEDKETRSQDRNMVKIEGVKFENNTLPIALNNIFSNCFQEIGSEIVKTEIQKGFLNFTVRKTYSAGIECADVAKWEDLKNTKFSVNYYHSFAKMSALASEDYEAVDYPYNDTNTFGFFKTTNYKLAVDNGSTDESESSFLNRFNPKKKEVVYYLNKEFYEKGMEAILAATEEGIKRVNESFTAAGVDTKIVLKDGSDVPIGDLRYNFIILVKDPQASGVIGYGPSVTNPRTGEIINARTVMYYGTMKKYVRYTYNDIAKELNKDRASKKVDKEALVYKNLKASKASNQKAQREVLSDKLLKTHAHNDHRGTIKQIPVGRYDNPDFSKEIFSLNRKLDLHRIDKDNPISQIEEMSRMNVYHGSMFNFHSAVTEGLGTSTEKPLKLWEELTPAEQEKLIERLLPFAWVPTLVHEFGHNLGLRHNFNGSEDKKNYYDKQERSVMGVKKAVTYSSVMDYPYSELNSLPKMGKYDIAALRFGYKREVETNTGEMIKLEKDLSSAELSLQRLNINFEIKLSQAEMELTNLKNELSKAEDEKEKSSLKDKITKVEKKLSIIELEKVELKNYQYCTDEHVAVNPGCNRFDEGSDLTEIIDHYIDSYEKGYERRNLRGNKESFSGFDDGSYMMRIYGQFRTMRLVFEIYDRINQMYNLPAEVWETNIFLKDLKTATTKVNNFFLDVIKTPGINCLLIDDKGAIQGNYSINNKVFASEGEIANCFESETLASFANDNDMTVAQFGKNIDHAKSKFMKDHLKPYQTEISVRGIWIDKALAMRFLTLRELDTPNFNNSLTNFFDYPEFSNKSVLALIEVFNDNLSSVQTITAKTAEGLVEIPNVALNYSLFDTSEIKESFHSGVNRSLGLKNTKNDLKTILMRNFKPFIVPEEETATSMEVEDAFKVQELDRNINYPYSQFVLDTADTKVKNNDETDEKNSNILGHRYGLYKSNTLATFMLGLTLDRKLMTKLDSDLMDLLDIHTTYDLKDLDPKILTNIYNFRLSSEILVMNAEQRAAYDAEIEKILVEIPGYEASFKVGLYTLKKYVEGTLESHIVKSMDALKI